MVKLGVPTLFSLAFARWLVGTALLLVCLLLPSKVIATSAALELALEQKKQQAAAFLQNNQFEAAYSAFMQVLRDAPDDDEVNLGLVMSAFQAKKFPEALMACERLVDKYPNDARLRLQLARIYVALGEHESARIELMKAKSFDPEVTEELVQEIVAGFEKQASRWISTGRVTLGVMYDTNTNQGPVSNTISLGIFDNLFVDGVKEKGSWGTFASANMELGYRLGDDSPWWAMFDTSGYQRWNTSGSVNTNTQFSWGRIGAGFRHFGERSFFDIRMKAENGWQHHKKGEDQTIFSHGPEATLAFSVIPDLQLVTRGSWNFRDYSVSNTQDGQYWAFGEYVRYFLGESKHEIMFGAEVSGSDAYNKAYDYVAIEPLLRLSINLPYDLTLSPFVAYKEEKYAMPATGLETVDRIDDQWRVGGNLVWDISKEFSLDLGYQYIDNKSTSELYTYDQQVMSSGITWKF